MKRMIFLLITVLLIVTMVTTLTLAGCKEEVAPAEVAEGGTEEVSPVEEEPPAEEVETDEAITLRIVWSNEGDIPGAGNWFKEMAEDFNAENPNIL